MAKDLSQREIDNLLSAVSEFEELSDSIGQNDFSSNTIPKSPVSSFVSKKKSKPLSNTQKNQVNLLIIKILNGKLSSSKRQSEYYISDDLIRDHVLSIKDTYIQSKILKYISNNDVKHQNSFTKEIFYKVQDIINMLIKELHTT